MGRLGGLISEHCPRPNVTHHISISFVWISRIDHISLLSGWVNWRPIVGRVSQARLITLDETGDIANDIC